jgi:Acetyltransferase (GNAT) domain
VEEVKHAAGSDDGYRIARISDAHMEGVTYLFNALFQKKVTTAYLRQKYDTAYCGLSQVSYLAYTAEGEVVALYGALPFAFQQGALTMHIVQACDSLTLPTHQRRGLHFRLANAAYEDMRAQGVWFVFALHSDTTYQHTKRLGWKAGTRMSRFHVRINTLPVNKIIYRFFPALFPAYDRWVRRRWRRLIQPDAWFDNPLHAEGWLCVRYTPAFFRYKAFSGSYILHIEGIYIWVKLQGALLVGALSACDEAAVRKVLDRLRPMCRRAGISEILFQISSDTRLAHSLAALLPAHPSWLVGYLDFNGMANFDALRFNFGDLDAF